MKTEALKMILKMDGYQKNAWLPLILFWNTDNPC